MCIKLFVYNINLVFLFIIITFHAGNINVMEHKERVCFSGVRKLELKMFPNVSEPCCLRVFRVPKSSAVIIVRFRRSVFRGRAANFIFAYGPERRCRRQTAVP